MVKAQGNNKNISVKATSVTASPNVNAKPVDRNSSVDAVNDLSKYYSDMSKYYSEQAQQSVEEAEENANRAEESAEIAINTANSILGNEQIQDVLNNIEVIVASPENAQIAEDSATLAQSYSMDANDNANLAKEYAEDAKEYRDDAENILDSKQDKLIAGENITIEDGVISASGGSSYAPPLLSHQWTDHILNDIRWLRADTFSWQDGGVYFGAYDTLETEYNNENSVEETDGTITYKRTPNGYKIADVSQEEAILNKYNTDGIAWYYIIDTVNKRFKLPRTKYGFTGIRDGVGNDVEAGLPNITGSVRIGEGAYFANSPNGCFASFSGTSLEDPDTGGSGASTANFDASASNAIYGNSDTVQPPATQMYLYFYVGSYTTDAIEQTAGITSEQLNNKLDLDLGNATVETKDIISGLPLPSGRYIDLTLGASGTKYIAPANGWVLCSKRLGANEGLFLLSQNSQGQRLCEYSVRTPSLSDQGGSIPVQKNQPFFVYYDGTGAVEFFRFIYAEGAE